ncbi:phosphate-starvation-inducible PsiE family protein [Clostridium sp. MB40-C1]|uniref:phosphate-starvation-inducible PsiE family protein n=1 Tax=Clostridium sp. MB40-C1 TaxID=3070996 RepID=UPI0027E0E581|nr:phosphate-starvation-inducible PsiE family protein [Clostridium sp. MB40-C1]WMJ80955.1 phosphate-starvation-inducible PsiE family protein [Clostridium sp. MB40-C1]
MKKKAMKEFVFKLSHIFEIILALMVLLKVLLGTIDLFRMMWVSYIQNISNPVTYYELEDLFGYALLLVIGVELVVMLTLHTAESVIDVLLYAIARKILLIPKDKGMTEIFMGILAIVLLFGIKKYLFIKKESLDESSGSD